MKPTPPWPLSRQPLSLAAALVLYCALAVGTAGGIGLVGEVASSWALDASPQVLVDGEHWADGAARPTAGNTFGPLVASQARPIERLDSLPLAVNMHTGGLPDWPAWLVWRLTGSTAAVTSTIVLLGALLIVGVFRFLRQHGTDVAAAVAALVLATDWSFLFYKKVLGGTEVVLQAAVLLCLWSVWSRRWSGGRRAVLGLAAGLGLGIGAKLTFVLSGGALLAATVLMRWDRPALRPPMPSKLWKPAGLVLLLTAPLWITWLHHHLGVDPSLHVKSHDFAAVQVDRLSTQLLGGQAPARESLGNIAHWALSPLVFFERAYQASGAPGASPWAAAGWLLVAAGTALGWRQRHPTPHEALLRFASVFVPLQVAALGIVARDLHHLAQAAPGVAIWTGLALDRLAAAAVPRSARRGLMALALAAPAMVGGIGNLARTDAVVDTISVPTFTEAGQRDLVSLLERNGVSRLVASDYELTGVLEVRAPAIDVVHVWGLASRDRGAALNVMLQRARDHHLLVIRSSAPMIYNLHPSQAQLAEKAGMLGLSVSRVDALPDDAAVLYRVVQN